MVSAQESVANSTRSQAEKAITVSAARMQLPLKLKISMYDQMVAQRIEQTKKLSKLLERCEIEAQKLERMAIPNGLQNIQNETEVFSRRVCVIEDTYKLRRQYENN